MKSNIMKKIGKILLKLLVALETILVVIISTLAMLLCRSIIWMFETWPYLSMSELVYQLNAPIEGTNHDMIMEYASKCIPPAVLVLFVAMIIFLSARKKRWLYQLTAVVLSIVSIGSMWRYLDMTWTRLDIANYLDSSTTYSSFIDDNYADPSETELIFPETKRNLIYIFLESMETTYTDIENGGGFEKSYIPQLTQIAQENEDFSGNGENPEINGAVSLYGTTWTIGAMFGHSSGLPLSIPIESNSMNTQEHFFPELTTLGDILQDEGYQQTLMIGSQAVFGGRKLYYTEHGEYNIEDYDYFRSIDYIPEGYWVWWGFEDQRLFQFAREKLTELGSSGEPFNFTMLTVDTHFENGYRCELCTDDDPESGYYSDVIRCSDAQVAELIRWIQQQPFYENTTIVVAGDHPTMDSDFCAEVDSGYERRVYTSFINAAAVPEKPEWKRYYSTFDLFPTTLAALGVQIDGNMLGLGTNLFSDLPTLLERYSRQEVNRQIQQKSELMEELNSGIENPNAPLEGNSIVSKATANMYTQPYDIYNGTFEVMISDIQGVNEDIMSLNIAVWTKADKSDLTWQQAVRHDDGSYTANVSAASFGYKKGTYYIGAYAVNDQSRQTYLGYTTGIVK